jgi:hypothetical protein
MGSGRELGPDLVQSHTEITALRALRVCNVEKSIGELVDRQNGGERALDFVR